MAPSFYHYLPVPMDEMGGKQGWGSHRQWLGAAILVVLFGVTLVILTIYFAVTANSVACRDGLRAQAECRNTTHLLQRQLTRTQDSLLQAETQANSCNLTVVTLQESLEKKVSQALEQQARIKELENEVTLPGLSENDLMVLSYGQNGNEQNKRVRKDDVLSTYALGLFKRHTIEHTSGVRDGWELALEVVSRLDDAEKLQKSVSELLDKIPLDNVEQLDKVVLLCSELGLDKEGRRVSERFGDQTVEKSDEYGLALVCYARAHSRRKVKSVVDLLISYSLVQSRAYPTSADLDEQLKALIRDPKTCLSAIAGSDEDAASILQFYFSGYATLRRFYEIRDEAIGLKEGQRPRFKPLARRRAAAQALVAVISSAADSIYGGLYDPGRDSAVQVDGLLTLLGEALPLIDQNTPVLSMSQQFTILSAIEDLETVTPRVYSQCEECFRSALIEYHSSERASSGGRSSSESYVLPPSPRALLKKSVSSLTASSTFSLIGSDMIESARKRTMSGSGSVTGSGVLVPRPGDGAQTGSYERGWDWRAALPEDIKGKEVLKMIRLGLARGLSFGALGPV